MRNSMIPIKRGLLERDDTYSLRGIAMILIIVSHTFNGYPTDNAAYFFPQWLKFLHMELWGGMGVDVFLLLSGYGLFLSLSRRETPDGQYIASKMKRLLQPYFIYWMVEILVLLIWNRKELTPHLLEEMATFSIHPDVENWFFKVIVGIYIMVIAVFKADIPHRVRLCIIVFASMAYLLIMKALGAGTWWYQSILCFPVGAIIAYKRNWFASRKPFVVVLAALAVIIASLLTQRAIVVFHVAFACMAIYLIRFFDIRNRLFYFVGLNSFIFYFVECPVMDEIMMFAYPNFLLYTAFTLIGTLLLSAAIASLLHSKKAWQ